MLSRANDSLDARPALSPRRERSELLSRLAPLNPPASGARDVPARSGSECNRRLGEGSGTSRLSEPLRPGTGRAPNEGSWAGRIIPHLMRNHALGKGWAAFEQGEAGNTCSLPKNPERRCPTRRVGDWSIESRAGSETGAPFSGTRRAPMRGNLSLVDKVRVRARVITDSLELD